MSGLEAQQGRYVLAGVYEHYKGGRYLVIGVAEHTETKEPLVVYVTLTGAHLPGPRLRVRPMAMFQEMVTWPDHSQRTRFVFCGDHAQPGSLADLVKPNCPGETAEQLQAHIDRERKRLLDSIKEGVATDEELQSKAPPRRSEPGPDQMGPITSGMSVADACDYISWNSDAILVRMQDGQLCKLTDLPMRQALSYALSSVRNRSLRGSS